MHGEYFDRTIVQYNDLYHFDYITYGEYYDFTTGSCVSHTGTLQDHEHNLLPYKHVKISECGVQPKERGYYSLRPLFGLLPADFIKQTFLNTTQYVHMPMSSLLKNNYKSSFPEINVYSSDKTVSTDTI